MVSGVHECDVFVCCLTDGYFGRPNCMREFRAAAAKGKLIVPLLMPGYCLGHDANHRGRPGARTSSANRGGRPPWPPNSSLDKSEAPKHAELKVAVALGARMYVDFRTEEARGNNLSSLVNTIDAEVRKRRAGRIEQIETDRVS